MLLLIDNYDSFTYNLVHFLGELGATCEVVRNDKLTADEAHRPQSQKPSSCRPAPARRTKPASASTSSRKPPARMPILGVCLGHQAIGQAYGGTIIRATPMHGKALAGHTRRHRHLQWPTESDRSHAIPLIDGRSRRHCRIACTSPRKPDDGMIMGLAHKDHPVHGVQFHPESIASEMGHEMLANFLSISAGLRPTNHRPAIQ